MDVNDGGKDICACILVNFFYAGSSALLISVAHLHPELWFISLIALIPFLFQVVRGSIFESTVLGAFLATSYCFVTVGVVTWESPATFLLKLLGLNVIFILYGIAVNRVVKQIGFNTVFIAVLWLPLEYGLSHNALLGSMFIFQEMDSTLMARISSLFGLLMVSFLVVLINSLILIVSQYFVRVKCSMTVLTTEADEGFCKVYWEITLGGYWNYFSNPRAPPLDTTA